MFMRRRRPLLGAAMLGGAVMAGPASQRAQDGAQDQDARLEQPQEQAPAPDAGGGIADQLKQLADLKQSGALSDEEFEAAKQKLLAS